MASSPPQPARASAQAATPRRSPRASPARAEQAENNLAELQKDLDAIAGMPWCGQAEKLGAVEREILSHFEHQIAHEHKLQDGQVLKEPYIKYCTKYEKPGKERKMSRKGLNATRLGELLLKSGDTPEAVQEQIASKMRSAFAKDFVTKLRAKRAAEEVQSGELMELQLKRKAIQVDGKASCKAKDRQATLDSFVNREPALATEHFNMNCSDFGWQLGRVTALITSATPRLFKRFNVHVLWQDGHGPCNLNLACYRHGTSAEVDSWVFLDLLGEPSAS